MPGYTRQMLSLVNAKVDMNNRFQLLMHQIYDCLLLFQTNLYIVTAPDHVNVPSKIRVEIIWESSSQEKHVCFCRLLDAEGDYGQTLTEIKTMCKYALLDSYTLGSSLYDDLVFGVNCLDNV